MHCGRYVRVVPKLAIGRRGAGIGCVRQTESVDWGRCRQRDRHGAVGVSRVFPRANSGADDGPTVLLRQRRRASAIADAGWDEDGPVARFGHVVRSCQGERRGRVVLEVHVEVGRAIVIEQNGRRGERRALLAEVDGEKRKAEAARGVVREA